MRIVLDTKYGNDTELCLMNIRNQNMLVSTRDVFDLETGKFTCTGCGSRMQVTHFL